MVAMERSSNG
jgi:hypothetical protein